MLRYTIDAAPASSTINLYEMWSRFPAARKPCNYFARLEMEFSNLLGFATLTRLTVVYAPRVVITYGTKEVISTGICPVGINNDLQSLTEVSMMTNNGQIV
jgi:hypothetical protein